MTDTSGEENARRARRALVLGVVAALGAPLLAVLGWACGAFALTLGITARGRGAGREAVVAIVLGGLGLVLGVANAVFGAYLLR